MKRHSLITRIWHWLNALAFVVLFMSGLNISNAHRFLYWGDYGFDPSDAWTSVMRFPAWATIPQRYDLAEARDWHNSFAWIFAVSLLVMWVVSLANGHFWRDLRTKLSEWSPKALAHEVRGHIGGNFGKDEVEGRKYNTLQRISYGLVLGIFLPMMIFTGLAISPGFEVAAPWLVDALGGRQSARSLHFLFAWATFGFLAVHLVMVMLSGAGRQIKGMITGNREEKGLWQR